MPPGAAGVQVDPEALGIRWRVPADDDLSGTIATRDAATLGLVDAAANRMVLTVRVDNNPTLARIGAPTLDGAPAGTACGVLAYDGTAGTVATPFQAVQRNGYAAYSFSVLRGAGPAVLGAAGTAATSIAGPLPVPNGTAAALLGSCGIAGFSENLYVKHLATDGWSDQSQLDRSDVRAFVLAPEAMVS